MKRDLRALNWALLVAAAVVWSLPAQADWLVTNDGHRVETQGEWRLEGKTVVFELPTGELASMRASEVDLEESREATRAAITAAETRDAPAESQEPRPSVYRLTDADVGHVEDEDEAVADTEGDGGEPSVSGSLAVTEWDDETEADSDGILIRGKLSNQGEDVNGNIRLIARLYDEMGGFIASSEAELTSMALTPGETAVFEVLFPGVFDFSGVRFETEEVGFVTSQPERQETEDEFLEETEDEFLEENET